MLRIQQAVRYNLVKGGGRRESQLIRIDPDLTGVSTFQIQGFFNREYLFINKKIQLGLGTLSYHIIGKFQNICETLLSYQAIPRGEASTGVFVPPIMYYYVVVIVTDLGWLDDQNLLQGQEINQMTDNGSVFSEQFSIREQFANRFVTNLFADIQVMNRFLFLFTTISFHEYYPIREYINLTNIIPIHQYFSKYS